MDAGVGVMIGLILGALAGLVLVVKSSAEDREAARYEREEKMRREDLY